MTQPPHIGNEITTRDKTESWPLYRGAHKPESSLRGRLTGLLETGKFRKVAAGTLAAVVATGGAMSVARTVHTPPPLEISAPNVAPVPNPVQEGVETKVSAVSEYLSSANRRAVLREQLVFTGTRVIDAVGKGNLEASIVDPTTFKPVNEKTDFDGIVVLAGEKNGVTFTIQTYMEDGELSVQPVGMDYVELNVTKPTNEKDAGAVLCTSNAIHFADNTQNGIGAVRLNTGLIHVVDAENAADPTLDETADVFTLPEQADTTEEAQSIDNEVIGTTSKLLEQLLRPKK